MTAPRLTFKASPQQADAYGSAADACGVSRHLWMVSWLNLAAGLYALPDEVAAGGEPLQVPASEHGYRPTTHATRVNLSCKISETEHDAWNAAASDSNSATAPWAFRILDSLVGLSDLREQLEVIHG